MKHLMTAALALTLMGGTSAMAQQANDPHGQHGGGGGGQHAGGGAPAGGGQHGGGAPAGATHQGGGAPGGGGGHPGGGFNAVGQAAISHSAAPSGFGGGTQGNVHAYSHGGAPSGGFAGSQGGGQPAYQGQGGGRQGGGYNGAQGGYNHGSRGGSGYSNGGGAGYNGGGRQRFDPQNFPRELRAQHQFQWRGSREWRPQPGYYARHWGYGDRLPYGWYSSRWYINDYYDYDLPAPPYDYTWVRVGDDALLVNVYTGEVVEAEYGVFY